jgi:hypothetical protein
LEEKIGAKSPIIPGFNFVPVVFSVSRQKDFVFFKEKI